MRGGGFFTPLLLTTALAYTLCGRAMRTVFLNAPILVLLKPTFHDRIGEIKPVFATLNKISL